MITIQQTTGYSVPGSVRVAVTPASRYENEYTSEAQRAVAPSDCAQARDCLRLFPGYDPTPLLPSGELAEECRVSSVHVKHEGYRQPTSSFKLLGPPYALVQELVLRLNLSRKKLPQLLSGGLKPDLEKITTCAATSGNHGRALAWAATRLGCRCRIYLPESTGAFREQEIKRFGATTIRVPGTYDDAVERAVQEAAKNGYLLVGDGAPPGSRMLRHIIHGYSLVGEELLDGMRAAGSRATHVFIPAGSGSLAAGVVANLWMSCGAMRPKCVVVQSHSADAAYQSCLRGSRAPSRGDLHTLMDGLSVRELSPPAWTILSGGAFAFATIDDQCALATLRKLSNPGHLGVGETGVAALAALRAAAQDPQDRAQLALDHDSRVVLIATEGITDPQVMAELLDIHC